jgi:hypothetical protein
MESVMRKLMLLAGVAALSVSLPAVAKNDDRGRGRGGDQAAERSHGGGHGRAERGRGGDDHARAQSHGRGRDNGQRFASRGRGGDDRGGESRGRGRDDNRPASASRGRGNDDRADQRMNRDQRRIERAIREERQMVRQARQERPDRAVREARNEGRRDWHEWSERRLVTNDRFRNDLPRSRNDWSRSHAFRTDGCPPGLARQNPYCMPPGQLRKAQLIGQRVPIANWAYNVPDRYSYRFVDSNDWFYRYDDAGYVYRFDRGSGLVSSIVPIFGNDLLIGEPLPLGYEVYNVPLSYRPYYEDSSDYLYRYDDSAIYQVDAESMLIQGIVALLTGGVGGLGGLGIGDTLPSGYDAYNLPLDYRDDYVDSDDAWYRYADGSIYEVDPETRLIQEVISLIV